MTFLEAAIELLRQAGGPLSVSELTRRALSAELLTNPGRNPEVTMQTRLATELKKGEGTLLVAAGDEFGLRRYGAPRKSTGATIPPPAALTRPVAPPPPAKAAVVAETIEDEADTADGDDEGGEPAAAEGGASAGDVGGKRRRRRRGGRGRNKKAGAAGAAEGAMPSASADAVDADDGFPEAGTPEEAIMAERLAAEAEAEAAAEEDRAAAAAVHDDAPDPRLLPPSDDEPGIDLDSMLAPTRRPRGLIDLPADEAALAAEYSDELAEGGVGAVPVPGEHVDAQTADEDRPLLPAIHGEERSRDRHRRGRRDRDRGRDRDRERGPSRGAQAAPAGGGEAGAAPAGEGAPVAPPPSGSRHLGDVGHQVLRAIGDGRPAHVRQLAAMALKRRLLAGDVEDAARALRAAMLDDARVRTARGLRPRVRAHGGSSFALAARGLEAELVGIEEALAHRLDSHTRETRGALRRRLARLPLPQLEQIAILYLERQGYTEIERVKRVENTAYLSAKSRRGATMLVGVRGGSSGDEGGRRSVGELRAGVVAKQLGEGLLLCTSRLGEEGERELRAALPPVTALDGEEFADALIGVGLCVIRASAPVAYLDPDFFTDLAE